MCESRPREGTPPRTVVIPHAHAGGRVCESHLLARRPAVFPAGKDLDERDGRTSGRREWDARNPGRRCLAQALTALS